MAYSIKLANCIIDLILYNTFTFSVTVILKNLLIK